MTRLMQICASQNDLFALDEAGQVYQYNFNTSTWMPLGLGRSGQTESPVADEKTALAPASPAKHAERQAGSR
jgi:hypothetical protein